VKLKGMAAILGVLALVFGAAGTTLATQGTGHKVTICHATSSEKNPYTSPTVDIASAGYPDGNNGHAGHVGDGVWYAGAKADGFDWGDIIPAYDYESGDVSFHFAGLNWTADGQAIWSNGCVAPDEEANNPAINVVKTPSTTTLLAGGGEVTYTYVVTNTGDVPLSDVSVSDDKCGAADYVSGDTSDDELLDMDETWTFTCKMNLTDTTTNIGTASGTNGDDTVTDTDTATVTVEPAPPAPPAPSVSIDKTVDPTLLPEGGASVTYTYVVTNTGDVALHNIMITDDNGTPGNTADDWGTNSDPIVIICPATTLAVGEHMTCTAAIAGTTVTTTNIATVDAIAGEITHVFDTDDATVTVGGGGVQGDTSPPTAPPTDLTSGTSGTPGSSLPILLLVLGGLGLGALVVTPRRKRG